MSLPHPAGHRRGSVDAGSDVTDEFDEVIDPAAGPPDPAQRQESRTWDLLLAVAAGGVVGAEARYGLGLAVTHHTDQFPWSTVIVNATGCLLIGALMVVLLELTSPHRLARPFLGVGVLGGYTTYSTFAVDVQRLVLAHRPVIAVAYVLVTVIACGAAVWLSMAGTQTLAQGIITARLERREQQGERR